MILIEDAQSSAGTLNTAPPSSEPNTVQGAAAAHAALNGNAAVIDLVVLGEVPLPVVPLYDLNTAAALVPMTPNSIRWHLNHYKEYYNPPVYRRCPGGRKLRLVSAFEIRTLRKRVLCGPGVDHTLKLYPKPTGDLSEKAR